MLLMESFCQRYVSLNKFCWDLKILVYTGFLRAVVAIIIDHYNSSGFVNLFVWVDCVVVSLYIQLVSLFKHFFFVK